MGYAKLELLLPHSQAGAWERAWKSDEFLVATILNGRQGTAMPPWQPFISHDEALWLVGVLRKNSD